MCVEQGGNGQQSGSTTIKCGVGYFLAGVAAPPQARPGRACGPRLYGGEHPPHDQDGPFGARGAVPRAAAPGGLLPRD
eukprot:1078639-Prorocentrum_minimum.AAC.1